MRFWDVNAGRELRQLVDHAGTVASIAFSSDGSTLAETCADGTGILRGIESGRDVRVLSRQLQYVYGVTFSPDGRLLAEMKHALVLATIQVAVIWVVQRSILCHPVIFFPSELHR